jgi:hypothetical protein
MSLCGLVGSRHDPPLLAARANTDEQLKLARMLFAPVAERLGVRLISG